MGDDSTAIERLARVFLGGFQIPPGAAPEEAWQFVSAEFTRLAATLPTDEATVFEAAVRRLIAERVYLTPRRHRARGRTKSPPA